MPIDPFTWLLIGGGALLLASRKKRPAKKKEPEPGVECPPGFVWSEEAKQCIPHLAPEEPPQLHITGDCEAWQMLPSVAGWFTKYAQPKFESFLGGIDAQATGTDSPDAVGPGGAITTHEMTVAILAKSPIAFATDQFPDLGSMCALPTSGEDPNVPPAMLELYLFVRPAVEAGIRRFNTTNEGVLAIPEGG